MMIAGSVMLISLMSNGAPPASGDAAQSVPIDSWIAPGAPESRSTKVPPSALTLEPHARPPESGFAALNHRWYGWQLILADLSSFAIGHEAKTGKLADLATVGLIGAGPAIHIAHGDWQRGIVSLVGRTAFVAAAVHFFGVSWRSPQESSCSPPGSDYCLDGATPSLNTLLRDTAFLLASGGFLVLDEAVLSLHRDVPLAASAPAPATSGSFLPTVTPTAGGLAMGLVGRF